MEIVWGEGWREFAVSDVHDQLSARREIAYTTVMTTVSRLYDKGLLDRTKQGRRYVYQPRMTHDEFVEAMTREVLESLPPMGQDAAMAMLVDRVAEADAEELDRLETLIQARRQRARGASKP